MNLSDRARGVAGPGRAVGLVGALILWMALPCVSGPLRVAYWDVELNRRGPGLLLQDIQRGKDPQLAAVLSVAKQLDADILVLSGIDYDHDGIALGAFADRLGRAGSPYPYRFTRRPNTGLATGLDLDGDGRLGGPGDAQGWGRFSGEGGLAVLSRLPFDTAAFRDFSGFLWRDLPGALLPPGADERAMAVQRLSTTAHWALPVMLPDGRRLTLLLWHATPPVFDGPEDRNGRRNHDEAAFWLRLLAGDLDVPAPEPPFVLAGTANLDTVAGDGRPDALEALMASPKLQNPAPRGTSGETALATADFSAREGPGRLRVDYMLPSADLTVAGAAVLWPKAGDPLAETLVTASRHRPVTVDLMVP